MQHDVGAKFRRAKFTEAKTIWNLLAFPPKTAELATELGKPTPR